MNHRLMKKEKQAARVKGSLAGGFNRAGQRGGINRTRLKGAIHGGLMYIRFRERTEARVARGGGKCAGALFF